MTPKTIELVESIGRIEDGIDTSADWLVNAINEYDPELRAFYMAMNHKASRELVRIIEREEAVWQKK